MRVTEKDALQLNEASSEDHKAFGSPLLLASCLQYGGLLLLHTRLRYPTALPSALLIAATASAAMERCPCPFRGGSSLGISFPFLQCYFYNKITSSVTSPTPTYKSIFSNSASQTDDKKSCHHLIVFERLFTSLKAYGVHLSRCLILIGFLGIFIQHDVLICDRSTLVEAVPELESQRRCCYEQNTRMVGTFHTFFSSGALLQIRTQCPLRMLRNGLITSLSYK